MTPYELLVVATALGVGCGADTLVDQVGAAPTSSAAQASERGPALALPKPRVSDAPGTPEKLLGAPARYPAGNAPRAIATADFDGDGAVDVAVGDGITGAIHVLLGRGDGSFAPAAEVTSTGASAALVAGDFDGDGRSDLAGAGDGAITVIRNEGNARWGAPTRLSPVTAPVSLASADLDLDGRDDLLAASLSNDEDSSRSLSNDEDSSRSLEGSRGLALYLAPLQDTTRPPRILPSDPGTRFVTTADLDGDGWVDVIGAASGSRRGGGTLTVLENLGSGELAKLASYAAGYVPLAVVAADLDGDGQVDLCARAGSGVYGLLRRGQKLVPSYYEPMMDASNALAAGDLDGDGVPELVSSSDDTLVVLRTSMGGGGRDTSIRAAKATRQAYDLPAATTALADLDNDGKLDVIATGAVVRVLLQRP